jgi:hypothetical protein
LGIVPTDRLEPTPRNHGCRVVARCKRLAIVVEEGAAAARREREAEAEAWAAVLRSAGTEPNADMAAEGGRGRDREGESWFGDSGIDDDG